MKCGVCCSLSFSNADYIKRIPIYPEEVDRLIEIAKRRQIPLKVKEEIKNSASSTINPYLSPLTKRHAR